MKTAMPIRRMIRATARDARVMEPSRGGMSPGASFSWAGQFLWAGLAVLFLAASGCQQEPGRWDAAQEASEGKTAQQSSADRLEGDDEISETPPPYNPGQPSSDNAPVTWQPKGSSQVSSPMAVEALTSGDPLPGGVFNKFFPPQTGEYDMVAKQEKQGFAQYSLRLGGEEIAQLSVTDLRGNPQAAEKFQQPDMTIAGYPAKKDGSKGTTLLVGGRFQVKVRSPGGNLNESDRMTWLQKFDLASLAELAN